MHVLAVVILIQILLFDINFIRNLKKMQIFQGPSLKRKLHMNTKSTNFIIVLNSSLYILFEK